MNLFLAILLIGFWSGSYIAIHEVVQVFPPALAAVIRRVSRTERMFKH